MHAVAVRFDLHVPASRSLKAKRAAIRPVVDGLRHRFKVSVAEVDYQDQWQRASIGVALVDGSAFEPGMLLFRLAGADPIWVVASVYQRDLAGIAKGAAATVRDPQNAFAAAGRVASFGPTLDASTHTIDVRIAVPNPRGALRPGMYVTVDISAPRAPGLAVPVDAVIPAGDQQIVFVVPSRGRYIPRAVSLGPREGDWYPVISGVQAGETVVTSGNFLVAAESRVRGGASQEAGR